MVFMRKDEKGMAYVYPVTTRLKDATKDIFMPIIAQVSREGQASFERCGYAWASRFMTYLIKAAEADANRETYGNLIGFWIKTIGEEIFQTEVKPQA